MIYKFSQLLVDELTDLLGESCGIKGDSSDEIVVFYSWLISNRSDR